MTQHTDRIWVTRGYRQYQLIAVATQIPPGAPRNHVGEWVAYVTVMWSSATEQGAAQAFGPVYGTTAEEANKEAFAAGKRQIDINPLFEGRAPRP